MQKCKKIPKKWIIFIFTDIWNKIVWHVHNQNKCFQVLFNFQVERQEGKMTVMSGILAHSAAKKEQNTLKFTMMLII